MTGSTNFKLTKEQHKELIANKDANSHIKFQIWNNQGKLILYSGNIPHIPFLRKMKVCLPYGSMENPGALMYFTTIELNLQYSR